MVRWCLAMDQVLGGFGENSVGLVVTCFSQRRLVALDLKRGGGVTVRGDDGFVRAFEHCKNCCRGYRSDRRRLWYCKAQRVGDSEERSDREDGRHSVGEFLADPGDGQSTGQYRTITERVGDLNDATEFTAT